MQWRIRDKRAARRATSAAQAAAVVLVASGAAMAMLGPRLLEVEEPEAKAIEPGAGPAPTGAEGGAPLRPFDGLATSENLGYVANKPEPDPETDLAGGGDAEPEAAPDTSKSVRYVGAVRSGDRMAAFVNIAGVTKMLRPGQAHDGVELISVEDDEIVVAIDGRAEERLGKAEREGPAVTLVVGGAPEPPPVVAGDVAESPQFTPDMSREERRAMLLERAREERSRWDRDRDDRGERPPPDRTDN